MCFKLATLALVCLGGLAVQSRHLREKRQLGQIAEIAGFDQQKKSEVLVPAAAGFVQQPAPVAHTAGGKYFQYAHQPAKDHYEHGHKRGNEHHFIERHERGHPHEGEFKTKVRWGDKHGGYGEHYWDFNHAGHGKDGEESQHHEAYEEYDASESAPYGAADTNSASTNEKAISLISGIPSVLETTNQRNQQREKRNPDDDVEFVDEQARSRILDGSAPKHGGNYRKAKEYRPKRHPVRSELPTISPFNLFFDASSGYIIDQRSGRQFKLSPVQ